VPLLGNCSKATFLLGGVGVFWSSAARSVTGVRVHTIASCLLLADRVQELINIAAVLLIAVLMFSAAARATTLPTLVLPVKKMKLNGNFKSSMFSSRPPGSAITAQRRLGQIQNNQSSGIRHRRPKVSRKYFGALIVGYHSPKGLHFAGRVGTGFSEKVLVDLCAGLQKLKRATCPFVETKQRGFWSTN
jgi:hypothetical protein